VHFYFVPTDANVFPRWYGVNVSIWCQVSVRIGCKIARNVFVAQVEAFSAECQRFEIVAPDTPFCFGIVEEAPHTDIVAGQG
jgi:hypothetical protein